MKICNMLGEEVRTLVSETEDAGYYQVMWDGRNNGGTSVASGMYTYRLVATGGTNTYVAVNKMLLMK